MQVGLTAQPTVDQQEGAVVLPDLASLPLALGHEQLRRDPGLILVGHTMKESREKALGAQKMLLLVPQVSL